MSKGPKVFLVTHQNQADYKVFFCNHENQQKNHQLIEHAELAKTASQATMKLFIVKFENQADIKITQKNFKAA